MKSLRIFPAFALLGCLAFSHNIFAAIDPAAPVALLRTSCNNGAGGTLHNCFTSGTSLINWIKQTRKPDIKGPLLVEIGPGTFSGFSQFNPCNISFRGSGRQKTILDRGTTNAYGLDFTATCNTDFSSLTVQSIGGLGGINPGASNGITTTWTDVEVISTSYGWTEGGCSTAKHYWFNSRIVTSTGFGIARAYSTCSENWFFGSEITAIATGGSEAFAFGLDGVAPNETHVYGSVIRAIANPGVILPNAALNVSFGKVVSGLVAVSVGTGAEFHVHGTGIDVLSTEANHVAVLGASAGAEIHADQTAYNISTGSGGSVSRILNSSGQGHVHAPYLWQHIPTSPLISVTGADMTTETVGANINLLVYNSQCTGGGPWYNVVSRSCR